MGLATKVLGLLAGLLSIYGQEPFLQSECGKHPRIYSLPAWHSGCFQGRALETRRNAEAGSRTEWQFCGNHAESGYSLQEGYSEAAQARARCRPEARGLEGVPGRTQEEVPSREAAIRTGHAQACGGNLRGEGGCCNHRRRSQAHRQFRRATKSYASGCYSRRCRLGQTYGLRLRRWQRCLLGKSAQGIQRRCARISPGPAGLPDAGDQSSRSTTNSAKAYFARNRYTHKSHPIQSSPFSKGGGRGEADEGTGSTATHICGSIAQHHAAKYRSLHGSDASQSPRSSAHTGSSYRSFPSGRECYGQASDKESSHAEEVAPCRDVTGWWLWTCASQDGRQAHEPSACSRAEYVSGRKARGSQGHGDRRDSESSWGIGVHSSPAGIEEHKAHRFASAWGGRDASSQIASEPSDTRRRRDFPVRHIGYAACRTSQSPFGDIGVACSWHRLPNECGFMGSVEQRGGRLAGHAPTELHCNEASFEFRAQLSSVPSEACVVSILDVVRYDDLFPCETQRKMQGLCVSLAIFNSFPAGVPFSCRRFGVEQRGGKVTPCHVPSALHRKNKKWGSSSLQLAWHFGSDMLFGCRCPCDAEDLCTQAVSVWNHFGFSMHLHSLFCQERRGALDCTFPLVASRHCNPQSFYWNRWCHQSAGMCSLQRQIWLQIAPPFTVRYIAMTTWCEAASWNLMGFSANMGFCKRGYGNNVGCCFFGTKTVFLTSTFISSFHLRDRADWPSDSAQCVDQPCCASIEQRGGRLQHAGGHVLTEFMEFSESLQKALGQNFRPWPMLLRQMLERYSCSASQRFSSGFLEGLISAAVLVESAVRTMCLLGGLYLLKLLACALKLKGGNVNADPFIRISRLATSAVPLQSGQVLQQFSPLECQPFRRADIRGKNIRSGFSLHCWIFCIMLAALLQPVLGKVGQHHVRHPANCEATYRPEAPDPADGERRSSRSLSPRRLPHGSNEHGSFTDLASKWRSAYTNSRACLQGRRTDTSVDKTCNSMQGTRLHECGHGKLNRVQGRNATAWCIVPQVRCFIWGSIFFQRILGMNVLLDSSVGDLWHTSYEQRRRFLRTVKRSQCWLWFILAL